MAQDTSIATSKKIAVTISLPNPSVLFLKIIKNTEVLFSVIYNPLRRRAVESSNYAGEAIKRSNFSEKFNSLKRLNKKKLVKMIFPVILVVIALIIVISIVKNLPDAKSNPSNNSTQVDAPDAVATINLDRKFSFPLRDEKGKEVGSFDYVILSAAIQKQIIVQGQRATAVNGRSFLILNLKITNNLKKTIQLNTRDYLRLTVASNLNEQLAPDIHNDPVEVQAISTKFTRVGIALDESDTKKTINLKVGEIDGTKQNIDLDFKY